MNFIQRLSTPMPTVNFNGNETDSDTQIKVTNNQNRQLLELMKTRM